MRPEETSRAAAEGIRTGAIIGIAIMLLFFGDVVFYKLDRIIELLMVLTRILG